jgi:hypothetical protein
MAKRPSGVRQAQGAAREPKLLAKMEANPKDDWRIEQVLTVAERLGLVVHPPNGGSHYVFSSVFVQDGHANVPYKRPIKPLYVRQFTRFCRAHLRMQEANEQHSV